MWLDVETSPYEHNCFTHTAARQVPVRKDRAILLHAGRASYYKLPAIHFQRHSGKQAPEVVRRICVAKGWVVHGVVFELRDGKGRRGSVLRNGQEEVDLSDDAAIRARGGVRDRAERDSVILALW